MWTKTRQFAAGCVAAALLAGLLTTAATAQNRRQPEIDFGRARQLLERQRRGGTLTQEEKEYLDRARAARRQQAGGDRPGTGPASLEAKSSPGLVPLCDMGKEGNYQGEDGGLYGAGQNAPTEPHRRAAERQLAQIRPLDAAGRPAADGKVVLVSISMSNATQEFSQFKRLADADPEKSPRLVIVDCAQGGQAMAEWAPPEARPWTEALRRIEAAGVSPQQVQVAWIKLANKMPTGGLAEHGRKLERDTLAVLHNAKARFPNLRIAYLGSRIYGGYAAGSLNPEPQAYEGAFVVRWLIQRQMRGDAALNHDPAKGVAKAPLLLWGPYFWADGTKGRKFDSLVWQRDDLGGDGTHPSPTGREKVAKLLLDFFKIDPLAKVWFVASTTKEQAR